MLFPESAHAKIADTFYDKTVEVLEVTDATDAEGGATRKSEAVKSTFKGNVRFVSYGEKQSDKGLLKDIDITITCSTDTPVELSDVFRYGGVKYLAVSVIPFDSHKEVQGQKWLSAQ